MRFGSVCSGIEAASCAWEPLGWKAQFLSEIEPFPCSVLAHHYPTVPNLGDMTKFKEWNHYDIDVLVGGTPCQSFSVAGLRKGLDDPRGNLMLTYLAIADKYRPKWLVWENVPGVLSSNGGKDFGTLLGGMGELGYGFAYRVFDAQYFGVPQRRRRVFVVGCLGDWRGAAAVLFERQSLQGNPAPARKPGARIAHTLTRGAESSGKGGYAGRRQEDDFNIIPVAFGGNNTAGPIDVATALNASASASASGRMDFDSETFIVQAFDLRGREGGAQLEGPHDTANIRAASGGSSSSYVAFFNRLWWAVRRLTPKEKERLQGFPDDYTFIQFKGKPASEGARGKTLGNSMAVPVMAWIGRRIDMVESLEIATEFAA
jgi:DNA (cytosine-5)-methyltransferase 1